MVLTGRAGRTRDDAWPDFAALEPGQILRLNADPQSLIALECQDERIFWCRLAQSKSKFALVIEQPIDKQKELVADLISHVAGPLIARHLGPTDRADLSRT